jgi:propanediol utilization protein
VNTTANLIRETVEELFGEDIERKRWLFHPRESAVRARLALRLKAELNDTPIMENNLAHPQ